MEISISPEAQRLVELLQSKQGLDILLMDLRKVTDTTDFFIVCSGNSDQHVRALADEVMEQSKAAGDPPWHVEGYQTGRWILVDFVHVVVHVLSRQAREYYSLERLWGDAPKQRFAGIDDMGGDSQIAPADPDDAVFARS
jgi:ribosome-associated protein